MNEFFTDLEDITVSPGYLKGWRIFRMTAVALGGLSNTHNLIQLENSPCPGVDLYCSSDRASPIRSENCISIKGT